ncbi:Dsim\GD14855-PA-like protein [Anopheles sinensis]|uniref:Dsim\GD14855-PA-like protein n=1 Tax=Anopheles sinensis TaxID=74873 RepID=A0A084VZL0_ANOSI|nr:Dsim\GD14855-PA-like protein [Anopheles sinensis]
MRGTGIVRWLDFPVNRAARTVRSAAQIPSDPCAKGERFIVIRFFKCYLRLSSYAPAVRDPRIPATGARGTALRLLRRATKCTNFELTGAETWVVSESDHGPGEAVPCASSSGQYWVIEYVDTSCGNCQQTAKRTANA